MFCSTPIIITIINRKGLGFAQPDEKRVVVVVVVVVVIRGTKSVSVPYPYLRGL